MEKISQQYNDFFAFFSKDLQYMTNEMNKIRIKNLEMIQMFRDDSKFNLEIDKMDALIDQITFAHNNKRNDYQSQENSKTENGFDEDPNNFINQISTDFNNSLYVDPSLIESTKLVPNLDHASILSKKVVPSRITKTQKRNQKKK